MPNLFTTRFPLAIKLFIFFIGLLIGLGYLGYDVLQQLPDVLYQLHGIEVSTSAILETISPRSFYVVIISILVVFSLLVLDIVSFQRSINADIKDSLEERKLDTHFSHFFSGSTFFQILSNLGSVFSLYKSLENLKTSRIVLEVSTIRQIMNHSAKGILLINKNHVVTHINHLAEEYLGLISGELINQAISRKISNDILLSSLEKVFEHDQKFVDLDLKEDNLQASLIPLKDKFGDNIRAIVMLKIESPQESTEDNKTEGDKS